MLLKDLGEIFTFEIFFKVLPNNSFSVVFPQLPVIAIILVLKFFLKIFEASVKNFNVSFTFIWRLISKLFWTLETIANDALFLKDCFIKLFPSFFFPFIAKKISFFTSLEFILALLKEKSEESLLFPDNSLIIFNFKLLTKVEFLVLIAFKIIFLSEKKIFCLPICWVFSCPLPAINKISPVFKFWIETDIAFALSEISIIFFFILTLFLYLLEFY